MDRRALLELMDAVREAKFPMAVREDGIPTAISGEGIYEIREFVAALTAGYNLAVQQLSIKRQLAKAAKKEV